MDFFQKILPKGDKKEDKKKKLSIQQLFGGQPRTFHGTGQSLGGNKPGLVFPVVISDPGSLGIRVEQRTNSQGTAIVSQVVDGTQAQAAGLERGDVLCFAGSNGQEEITYELFLEMARSPQRPLHFEVRRIPANAAPNPSGSSGASADAAHRRQAMIAAAEAREMAHKAKAKPIRNVTKTTLAREKQLQEQQQKQLQHQQQNQPSEESKRAAMAAKKGEMELAQQLGYNPYETAHATAGQARVATTTSQHGAIHASTKGSGNSNNNSNGNSEPSSLPAVAPPRDIPSVPDDVPTSEPSEGFSHALSVLISSTPDASVVATTCNIMRKLLLNATTKGQAASDDAAKFRKVRLQNAKIKAALVDVPGAMDVMLCADFQLVEQDGESMLIFPVNHTGPKWLPTALTLLDQQSAASS
eukprot:Nitzschia sp. Nitz4//scaffold296_size27349//12739//14254//NITZ4_008199-RA/size27349-snap-gene-0.40-mRNA-1//1//CDS//3329546270//6233//frame0